MTYDNKIRSKFRVITLNIDDFIFLDNVRNTDIVLNKTCESHMSDYDMRPSHWSNTKRL